MSKVHITLVGGQPAPVYNGIVATMPDRVVFVYSKSKDSHKALEALKQEIDVPFESVLLSPTDPTEILAKAVELARRFAKDDVTVNISSGLKSWSHFFGVVFERNENAAVVYMDQNNVLWNYKTMKPTSGFVFDMHTLFRLYGNSLENNYTKFSDFTVEDERCIAGIEQIRAYNKRDFRELTSVLTPEQEEMLKYEDQGTFTIPDRRSYVEWEKPMPTSCGFVRVVLYGRSGRKEFCYESDHIVNLLFHTAWFEYKVASLLSRWEYSKEICMNCRFPFKSGFDKNETDIIVNTGTKLLFVECKTQIHKPTDIDKFRSVVKGYGGTGSKGIFITEAPMTELAIKKCEENGLLHFSLLDLKTPRVEVLYSLLNAELFNINA